MMKKLIAFSLVLFFGCAALLAQSPVGRWKTIDDATGKVRSIVEVYEYQGKLYGKIIDLLNRTADEDVDPICKVCPGARKDKKVKGMVILSGLAKSGSEWTGGNILDPKNGKEYSCTLSMENADKLKVRGYIGFSMIGRTQYWLRDK